MSIIACLYAMDERSLARCRADFERFEALVNGAVDHGLACEETDVDKAWAMIHATLTGDLSCEAGAPPLSFLVAGGAEFGHELGYDAPRAFEPGEVLEVWRALEPLTPQRFAQRFDHAALREASVYGCGDSASDDLEYGLAGYEQLYTFLGAAARDKRCLVIAYL